MSNLSTDYSNELTNIKNGTLVMNSSSATADDLLQTANELDNAAWVDFSEIRFFLEPETQPSTGQSLNIGKSAEDLELFNDIDRAGGDSRNYDEQFNTPFKTAILAGMRDRLSSQIQHWMGSSHEVIENPGGVFSVTPPIGIYIPYNEDTNIIDLRISVETFFLYVPWEDVADIADCYFSIYSISTSDLWATKEAFFGRIHRYFCEGTGDPNDYFHTPQLYLNLSSGFIDSADVYDQVIKIWTMVKQKIITEFGIGSEDIGSLREKFTFKPKAPPPEFSFMTFPAYDINLGMRLVYRQEWRPLGIQRGEVVKTIPLGPKQTEKVSTKITRRTKVTRTSESLKSTETSTETSDTAKDSSEIVNEASSAMKWNLNQEIEGGYNCGVWNIGGKTEIGYSKEAAESSKNTSSHLSETMRKTANKVRTETKVVVSTESETTYEATSASEIQNPNDEIAVTYVFSKFQRQYEILTRLAEVQDVIMVAEELPSPAAVDFD